MSTGYTMDFSKRKGLGISFYKRRTPKFLKFYHSDANIHGEGRVKMSDYIGRRTTWFLCKRKAKKDEEFMLLS